MKDLNRLRHSWLLCLPLLLNTQAAIAQDQFVDLQSNGGYTSYRLPDDKEKAALLDLAERLKALPADTTDGELIQNEVYAVGKAHEFEPLRAWFGALYEVLLGASQGPRFGSFAAIYGLPQTVQLIEDGANGVLAST